MMKHIVYRYIDKTDGVTKYVGITRETAIKQRLSVHAAKDRWKYKGTWRIEYFECENQSEAEAFESHLIALYETGKYYNKRKVGWGINQYLPSVEERWKLLQESKYADVETERAVMLFHWLLKNGYKDEAKAVLNCFECEG